MVTDINGLKAWLKVIDNQDLNQFTNEDLQTTITRLIQDSQKMMSELESLQEWKDDRELRDSVRGHGPRDDGTNHVGLQWVRAEPDSPSDPVVPSPTSCVGGGTDVGPQQVVVFNSGTKELKVQGVDQLREIHAVYSRLPSRLCKTVYVWSVTTDARSTRQLPSSTAPRWRITDKADQRHQVEGLLYQGAIHLNRLDKSCQIRIFMGRIRWLFILKPERVGGTTSTRATA